MRSGVPLTSSEALCGTAAAFVLSSCCLCEGFGLGCCSCSDPAELNCPTSRNASVLTGCAAGNPLPSVVHKTISQQQLGPGRLVMVGDVHGCLTELFELLDTVGFRYGFDNLLLTGDLCNKGPRCQEVR